MTNKKAQYGLIGMMSAVMLILFAFQMITPIKDEVTTARNSANLDCTNSSISTGDRMTCIAVDLYLPYFIIVALAAAGGYLIGKKIEYRYAPPQQ